MGKALSATNQRRLRIGIDGGPLANRRGFGRFAREVVAALSSLETGHEFVVLADSESIDNGTARVPDRFEVIRVPVREAPSRAASARSSRRIADMLAMGRAAAGARLDALYFPSSFSFFPVWNVGRVIVTVFDTMPLDYPHLIFPRLRHRWAWNLKERLAVAACDCLVTTSRHSRERIGVHYPDASERIVTLPCAPSSCFQPIDDARRVGATLEKYGIDPSQEFLIYVGGLSPHKNLARLIRAFGALSRADVALVIVGDFADSFHTHVPELRALTSALGLETRVRFTGFVPDGDLVCLYNAALALVQPSLVEGFGLPPVEAMACGTPVLASTAGSLPEVVGEAGLLFDPARVDAIAEALERISGDAALRGDLAVRSLKRSREFSWNVAAERLVRAIEACVDGDLARAA